MEEVFSNLFGGYVPKTEEIKHKIAKKIFSFADKLDDLNAVSLSVGPAEDPIVWLDNANRNLHGSAFFQDYMNLIETHAARFKIIHFLYGDLIEINVAEIPEPFVEIQPMGQNNYLIAAVRALAGRPNAWIVDKQGRAIEKFRIGDAIKCMQATESGNIWVGYFDEGVFGNDAYSQSVFACFDKHGRFLFPKTYHEFSDWCSGLNVESENCVWLLPSSSPLLKVEDFLVARTCERLPEIPFSAFAIADNTSCWAPRITSYSNMNFFTLSELGSGACTYFQPVDENRNVLLHELYAARGSKMYFTSGHDVYVLDVAEMHI